MPSDSNGTYALPSGYLAIGGDTILPSQHNPPLEDVAAGLTARLMRSGAGGMTGQFKSADGAVGAPGITFGSALSTGFYKTTAGFGIAVGGTMVGEFGPSGLIYLDQSVTYPKIVAPSAASRLLGSNANPALTITAAANNGSGLIRLTVASTSTFATGQKKIVSGVTGTTEANGRWTITVVDATHIDLQGSTFSNAYVSGGTIGGGVDEIKVGSGLTLTGDTLAAALSAALVPNYLSGLTMSTAGSSSTMSIAAGVANDSTNSVLMSLAATSKTTASWAAGSGNGGLDTGSIANNTWYHWYVIERPDTGVVDVIFSTSASTPALPTNYTLYRRIGSGRTNGSGQWIKFFQNSNMFLWSEMPALDFTATNPGTAAITVNLLGSPLGVRVEAIFNGTLRNVTPINMAWLLSSMDVADTAPGYLVSPLGQFTSNTAAVAGGTIRVWTNTSAQIRSRVSASDANVSLYLQTIGWVDPRGQ